MKKKTIKIHTPSVDGHLGDYSFIIDGSEEEVKGFLATNYSLEEMEYVNRISIYCDGIENVENGSLIYTEERIEKVKNCFDVLIPKDVPLMEAGRTADFLIEK